MILALAVLLAAPAAVKGATATLKAADASGVSAFTNNAPGTNWVYVGTPDTFTNYFTSVYGMRTPADGNSYTFGGDSLTLQPPTTTGYSFLEKASASVTYTVNNFTNNGGIIRSGGGRTLKLTIAGNKFVIAANSAVWADQNGWIINSPLSGSAVLTNRTDGNANDTIAYGGDNSAWTGKLVVNSSAGTPVVILNNANALPGNPAAFTPDQITLGGTSGSTLQDNVGVTYNNSNGGITLGAASTINAAANTVIGAPIAGAFALTKAGAGSLTLSGSNSFTGGLPFTAGQLNINSTNALGTGTLNVNGGTIIDNTRGSAISNANNNAVTISQSFTFAGSSDLDLGVGGVNNGSQVKTVTVSAGTLTFGGGFTGAGQLIKDGSGTLRLRGNSTGLGGGLAISAGTLALTGGTLITNTPNISIASGATLDVSGLSSTFTLGTSRSQSISNSIGTVNGSVASAGAGASISPDAGSVAGTLTFNNNLNLNAGGAAFLDLSTAYNSGNDQVVVGGNLTLSSSDTIHVNALGGSSPLDETADYVLFAVSGTTTMASTPHLVWDGTPPSNSGNYSVKKVGNNVVLHFSSGVPPTVSATISPDPSVRNQAVTITANVTKGSTSITGVTVDLTAIGGSSTAGLVLDGASSSDPNFVYTNTFIVAASAAAGSLNLSVTATDTSSPTPLTGTYNFFMTVNASSLTWDGGAANNSWSSDTNWTGDLAPGLVGDSVTFDGTTRLAPDVNNNYSVAGVTFNSGAGAFVIGSSTGGVLTNSVGIVNNATSPQTVNVSLFLSAAQTFNAASGNLILNTNINLDANVLTLDGAANTGIAGSISGTGGLTKTGNGTLTLTGTDSFGGSAWFKGGTTVVDTGGAVTTPNWCSVGQAGSDVATLTLKGTGTFTNSNDFNVGDIDSTAGTLNIQDSTVASVQNLFIGSANASGSTASGTVNISGGTLIEKNTAVGMFSIGGRNSATTGGVGILNLTNGYVSAACGIRVGDYGTGAINQYGGLLETTNGSTGINLRRQSTGLGGTYNLNGGILRTEKITSSQTTGDRLFYFNGGTVQAGSGNLGATPFLNNLSHAYVRNGGAIVDDRGYSIVISQALEHSNIDGDNATDGGLTKLGTGTLYLTGTNTCTGNTVVSNGVLAGTGIIASPVLVKPAGTIGAGNAGTSVGALTINNNLTLQGGALLRISKNGGTRTNDLITGLGTVNYGGTLVVSNVTTDATTLAAGDTFTLFSASTHNGNFTSITGSPGSGLAYSFTNGVLSVVSTGPSGPATLTNNVSGNTLSLSWPAGQGWRLQQQTNSLSTGLGTNWVYVTDGSTSSTNITADATKPAVFYRLVYP